MIIITVNFNRPNFLEAQLQLIQRYMQPLAIHVLDTGARNSGCRPIALKYDAKYTHIDTGNGDFSQCHAMGLNYGYMANRQLTDIIGFMDHDCFPLAPIDVRAEMEGFDFYCTSQEREGKEYPNPACMFVKTSLGNLDFMPSPGFDTAGQLHSIFHNVKQMAFEQVDQYEKFNGVFLHISKGSNWVETSDNAGRVERVFNYVKTFL